MKICFIAGANQKNSEIPPFVKSQAKSLCDNNEKVTVFTVNEKGLIGYLKASYKLYKFLSQNHFDILHCHHLYCGVLASLARAKVPIVVSLLGSEVNRKTKIIDYIFFKLVPYLKWRCIIVKSPDMLIKFKEKLSRAHAERLHLYLLPNGVNCDEFKPLNKKNCQEILSISRNNFNILFAADPTRQEKNYDLANKAVEIFKTSNIRLDVQLFTLGQVHHIDMPTTLNAMDVVLLTSRWEGSPNIIKEAMACNCVIVSVEVGDVRYLFDGVYGSFLAVATPMQVALSLEQAMLFIFENSEANGREMIERKNLTSNQVAAKLKDLYNYHCHV